MYTEYYLYCDCSVLIDQLVSRKNNANISDNNEMKIIKYRVLEKNINRQKKT